MQLMLAVNDEHGNPAGQVVAIAVGAELLELEGPGYYDDDEAGDTFEYQRLAEPKLIHINDRAWPVQGYAVHVGNIMWDAAEMEPAAVVDLVNYLQGLGYWNCTAGESGLFDLWHARQPIKAEDLDRAERGTELANASMSEYDAALSDDDLTEDDFPPAVDEFGEPQF